MLRPNGHSAGIFLAGPVSNQAQRFLAPGATVLLELPQQVTEWTLSPAFAGASYPRGRGNTLRNPAPRMRMVNARSAGFRRI